MRTTICLFFAAGLPGCLVPRWARTPYLAGAYLFFARVSGPLNAWILCDGPPDDFSFQMAQGMTHFLCYAVTTLFCFHIWSLPTFVRRLLSLAWRVGFSVPSLLILSGVYTMYL